MDILEPVSFVSSDERSLQVPVMPGDEITST